MPDGGGVVGEPCPLSAASEEVAGFYAAMLHSDYPKKAKFNENFFKGFREVRTFCYA